MTESKPPTSSKLVLKLSRRKILTWVVVGTLLALILISVGVWFNHEMSLRRTVPDLTGQTLLEAQRLTKGAELELVKDAPPRVRALRDANTVLISQSPLPGEVLKKGESVKATFAPREFEMPDIVGESLNSALSLVANAEFVLAHPFGEDTPLDSWKIVEQGTPAGKLIPAGSATTLKFDVPEIVMPDLQGKNFSDAEKELSGAGLKFSKNGDGTHVISSDTAAGEVLKPFTRVSLMMGYETPDVLGLSPAEAEVKLKQLFTVVKEGSAVRPIVSQSIPAGTLVQGGGEIVLISHPDETIYRVTGNGGLGLITWTAPGSFSIQQANEAPLPWEMSFPKNSGMSILSAQTYGGDSITCQIERNGKVIKELTSTGPYSVVSCDVG